jgi:hypothetical protein
MKRASNSKRSVAAVVVAVAALAAGSFAGVAHSAPSANVKPMHTCPPAC